MVSITRAAVPGQDAAIRRVASMPSSAASGRPSARRRAAPAAALDGLRAVAGLAHDLDVLLGLEDHRKPGPDQRLVVDEEHPDHAPADRRGPAGRRRAPHIQPRTRPPGSDRR